MAKKPKPIEPLQPEPSGAVLEPAPQTSAPDAAAPDTGARDTGARDTGARDTGASLAAAKALQVLPWLGVALVFAGLLAMPTTFGGDKAPLARMDGVHTAAVLLVLLGGFSLLIGQLKGVVAARALAVALAVLAVRWGELAVPSQALTQIDDSLRPTLAGVTQQAFAALAIAGLVALGLHNTVQNKVVAGLGTLGMALYAWMPMGLSGELRVPWRIALDGTVPMGATAGADVQAVALTHRIPLLLLGIFTLIAIAVLVLQRDVARKFAWGLAALLAVPTLGWTHTIGGWAHLLEAGGLLAGLALVPALAQLDEHPVPLTTRLVRAVEPLAVALLVGAYLLLKINGLRYSTTDESLYFYAAKLWSQGTLPYRDFFFSHPPLHLAPPAILYKLLGYDFLIGKWLSALAALIGGLFAWRIARAWLGPLGGVLTLALHLLACETLQASTNLTGVNLTTAWLMAGLWAGLVRRNFLIAGLLLGIAASTGFYAVGGVILLAVLAALLPATGSRWSERIWTHPATRALLGFVLVWGGLALIFRVIGGPGYSEGVYAYHFAKRAKVEGFTNLGDSPFALLSNFMVMLDSARDFRITLYYHAAQWWLALLLPMAVAARIHAENRPWRDLVDPRRWWQVPQSRPLLAWAATLALLIEFANFKERYDFYFALILPLASVTAAAFLLQAGEVARVALAGQRRALAWAVVLLLAGLNWTNINMAANRAAYPTEFGGAKMDGKGPGERLEFAWIDTPGPAWTSEWTQALFWKSFRIRGSIEAGLHHYLWGKKRWFSTAESIAQYVREHTADDETISGASDYAPLIALLADRRLAGNHVDTNSKVFNTGTIPLDKFWDDACRDKLKYIVAAPQSFFSPQDVGRRLSAVGTFRREQVFADPYLKHWKTLDIELWVREGSEPCQYKGQRGAGPGALN